MRTERIILAHQAAIILAGNGTVVGGAVGYDGADVEHIANKTAFEAAAAAASASGGNATCAGTPSLYFYYSVSPKDSAPWKECLEAYDGICPHIYGP